MFEVSSNTGIAQSAIQIDGVGDGKKREQAENWADVRGGVGSDLGDGSWLCCPKTDCDDGASADLFGAGRRAWWEMVVEREAVTKMGV